MMEEKKVEEKSEYPKLMSKGSSNSCGYSVEARYCYDKPAEICGQIFDRRWQEVGFKESSIGVPKGNPYDRGLRDNKLLGYSAAQALRWWFIANADASGILGTLCVQTRIVMHEIKTTHDIQAVSASDIIYGNKAKN